MIYYRLLRDNKESGPYAEDEMIAKGFKPYDLLWAEGKSAGWQYPSEINAFKKYTTIVEEQPFDRFYKKQGSPKTEATNTTDNKTVALADNSKNFSYTPDPVKARQTSQPQPAQPDTRPAYNFNVDNLAGRHIHVILPSGNTVNLTTLAAKKQIKEITETTTAYHTAGAENIVATAEKYTAAKLEPLTGFESVHESLTNKPFSAPSTAAALREKNVAAADLPARQPQVIPAAGFSWTLVTGAVIGIATLVGLGIMIGLSMNREKNEAVFNESLRRKTISAATVHNQRPAVVPTTNIPVASSTAPPEQHTTLTSKNKELVQHAVVKTISTADDAAREGKKIAVAAKPETQTNKLLQKQDEPVQSVKENIKPATTPTVSIEKSLSISENKFNTGAFGGISNLKCTLLNGSSFPLESVEVELDYIQANNKIYKTEKVFFKDIAAGAQITIDAPASTRGIKVNSRIIKVNARDANTPNTTAKS